MPSMAHPALGTSRTVIATLVQYNPVVPSIYSWLTIFWEEHQKNHFKVFYSFYGVGYIGRHEDAAACWHVLRRFADRNAGATAEYGDQGVAVGGVGADGLAGGKSEQSHIAVRILRQRPADNFTVPVGDQRR